MDKRHTLQARVRRVLLQRFALVALALAAVLATGTWLQTRDRVRDADVTAAFEGAESDSIAVAAEAAEAVEAPDAAGTPDGDVTPDPLRAAWRTVLLVLLTAAAFGVVAWRIAGHLAGFATDLLEANLELMEIIGCAVARRDSDSDAHNYRVTIYAVRLAEHVGLATTDIQSLVKGAFLHDVGNLGIGDDVLRKPGSLTEDEYAVVQGHVEHGVDIVCRAAWLQDALAVVASHHEKFDGEGYPRRMAGPEIPEPARIFAIVDAFDTLVSARPYKEPEPVGPALATLGEGRGTHFDPVLLDRFLEIAPYLYAELASYSPGQLRGAVQAINERYFAAAPQAAPV